MLSLISFVRNFLTLDIYTDGSSKDGVGSWAYVISRRGKRIAENSGSVRRANSNTMEFQAAIEALRAVSANSKINLLSDSKILVDTMKSGRGPAAQQAQIEALKLLSRKHRISWQWIKAHSGNQFNEHCDELCAQARKKSR